MPAVYTEQSLLEAINCGEEREWEFKSARGGLPGSLWETYSALANTDGGCIVLGVDQRGQEFVVGGLPDSARTKRDFWNTINNRGKVSLNLLKDEMVQTMVVDGQEVLLIKVPPATRRQRPVFVEQNPLTGTYRRNYEGDYRCTEEEVGRMLADRSDDPADSQILDGFDFHDLDLESLAQYRQRFSARAPAHPWLGLEARALLEKLGGWRCDRKSGQEGLTVAGLLMFGREEAIRDPAARPAFLVDYRERLSLDAQVRWTDRVMPDGTWVGNLFQFYVRVLPRLTRELKIPFQLDADLFRKDDTPVHQSLREALVNALIHADYRGQGGIVIDKYPDRFELSNPGILLVSIEQILRGGVSECRNLSLQQMFLMIGGGEKAGSGVDKIRQGWNSQNWRAPRIEQGVQPDRVRLVLPTTSLLPPDSVERLRARFGPSSFGRLGPVEVQALVTADVEGEVTNARLREITIEHPADLTRILQNLVHKRFLVQGGSRRWTSYQLPPQTLPTLDSSRRLRNSPHKSEDSPQKTDDSLHRAKVPTKQDLTHLRDMSAPARVLMRLPVPESRRLILDLCQGYFITAAALAKLINRNPNSLRDRFLTPMVDEGLLIRRYPNEPNRPDQAYTTAVQAAR